MNTWKKTLVLVLVLVIAGLCGVLFALKRQPEPLPEQTTVAATEQTTVPPETLPPETAPTEPEAAFSEVPLYFQTDYPYVRYGNGTLSSSGCSLTSLAMVATYMTEQKYLPDQLAYHFGSYGVNNIERLNYGIEQLGLPCQQNYDWQVTKRALQEGKVAIIMVDQRSLFCNGQHFMVLTGIDEEGRIHVHDPAGYNYRREDLMEGFAEGFPEYIVVAGLEGSWVFDKEAMPEDHVPFDASLPETIPTRYPGFTPTEQDKYLLASFVWAAAREESFEAQQAVAEVVLNRMVTNDYPNTVDAVMRASDTYHYWEAMQNVEPEAAQYAAVTNALYGPEILPKSVTQFTHWETGEKIWTQIGRFYFYEKD